ncbi:MAG TPA: tetratricopeptide repeat protein [Bryobacteraceae bacterium]|jgi:tetratricopeptide (TPR) repeat protein|nr:tetratricopeptide repeat protein [Bryobacteraceae bacterium]
MVLTVMLALALAAQQSGPAPPKPSKPLGTFDDSTTGPPHSLKSVGVRGTIDAGGYSSSATVKAQTEFYEQLIHLQIAALRSVWAPQDRCNGTGSPRMQAIGLLTRGEYSQAATALEALLRTDNQPGTRQLLGLAYEGSGQLEAAAEQFRLAAVARPDVAAMVAHGAALLFLGEVDQAEAVFHGASQQSAAQAALARLGLAAAMFQRGRIEQALDLFLNVASANPANRSAFGFIAVALRSADAAVLTRSINVLTSLTHRSPQDGGPHYALASALTVAAGGAPDPVRSAAIETHLKDAIRFDPQLADAHFRLAEIYAAREDLPSAIAEYRSALDCNPELVEAHYRLSQLYARSGQPELATEQLALHRQLRAQQGSQIERGAIHFRLPDDNTPACPGNSR